MKLLKSLLGSFYKNKNLIYQLTKRDILARYKGSIGGVAWSVITPLLMLTLYTFVFSYVFKARWGEAPDLPREMYALVLYSGMLIHSLFSECINKSTAIMLHNNSYVKKVVFPLETLNWVTIFSALFQFLIGFALLLLGVIVFSGELGLALIFTPLLLFPFVLCLLGFCWIVAALGVYFRDVSHLASILTTVLMFASPIFYPVSMLPEKVQGIIYLNPLTYFIEEFRSIVLWNKLPELGAYFIALIIGFSVAIFGFSFFQKTRKGFADVL